MCLNSDLLDLRPPGHFKIGFFASRITGYPSASELPSCEIIMQNNSHGEILQEFVWEYLRLL